MPLNVPQKNTHTLRRGIILRLISIVTITLMVFPLLIVDLFTSFYHAIYFRINGIPLIPRSRYIIIDCGRLMGLNWVQRWNCVYCDYANGLIAWTKAVINTPEAYNCATARHQEEHQKEYFEYEKFR